MNRKMAFFAVAFALVSVVVAAQQPTLADEARAAQQKQGRKATRVYTNENLPKDGVINVTGATLPEKTEVKADEKTADGADTAKDDASKDKEKAAAGLKEKIAAQKKEIALLQRELDVLQRENKLRAATYYADAGNRLRDEKKYAEDDRKYQADIATKQKALDAARQKLEEMKEAARRAGLPASIAE